MEKLLKDIVVISLVGPQGSGKTTIGKELADYLKTIHIETSSVVQESINIKLDRDELYQTSVFTKDNKDWLGRAVEAKILKWLRKKHTCVISGVREVEVHSYLRRQGARVHVVGLTVSPELRYKRLKHLGKVKSATHFLQKELNERSLGLHKVMMQAKHEIATPESAQPREVAKSLQRHLVEKGIKCN